MGVRGAHEDTVQQVGQAQVADIMADALDEARVFFALIIAFMMMALFANWTIFVMMLQSGCSLLNQAILAATGK